MSGDYSRWSFDPRRDVAAVLMQQGRVHTDSDWNESVATVLRRLQADSLDTLGQAVVPRETPDGFRIEAAGGTFTIGPGRMYVDGLLVENHGDPPDEWDARLAELRGTAPTPYDAQPHLPQPPALPGGGPHLVYLKAWRREVTAIEEPELIEKALGVDTTTHLRTVWQAKLLANVGGGVNCSTPLEDVPGFLEAEPPAAGRLTTGTADVPGEPDPCLVPPSGGYKGRENQLYRIEIHDPGDLSGADRATFKWSRDNGSVASRVTEIPALDRIVVESVGRDDLLRFSDGDWVEITDDFRELAGLPGEMRRIQTGGGVDDATRTIRLEDPLPAGMFPVDAQGRTTPERNTRVRRWDQQGRVVDANGNLLVDLDGGGDGTIKVVTGATQVVLENGVVATFDLEPSNGRFRTGDHWVFAARTADASVEVLQDAPPRGTHAHYANLALVTFPDAETDCRTLWPPQVTEAEGGCECSVCVTPESHAGGDLTIQAAIDQVKETGGTVCLAVGTYPLERPVEIHDARSVCLRGQGAATVIVATAGEPALDVRRCNGVVIERLGVVGSSSEKPSDAIRVASSIAVAVERCVVVDLAEKSAGGAAIRLEGVLIGARIVECALAAHTGIAGGTGSEKGFESYLVTASLRIDSNWLWCTERGIDLGLASIHIADTRIAGNTIANCESAGVVARGGNVAGPFNVEGNALSVGGDGIVAGVDALRIADNHVEGGDGDGIALEPGLDAAGIDDCQVLANRIREMRGHGIAIRTRIETGMIKHNIVAGTGGGGIVMEGAGSAGRLVVENNQLGEIARRANKEDVHVSALRFFAVAELDVAGNTVDRFALEARQAASRSAILAVASTSARIEGNRLTGIAPAQGFLGLTSGIELVTPLRSAAVAGNTVRRRADDDDKLANGEWVGVLVRGPGAGSPRRGGRFLALGDVAVANLDDRVVVFGSLDVLLFAKPPPGDVSIRGNEVVSEASDAPPLVVAVAALGQLADNRIRSRNPEGRGRASQLRCIRAIASGNDLRGVGDSDVLEIELPDKEKDAAILGNVGTGRILLNGNPLGNPWAPLNLIDSA